MGRHVGRDPIKQFIRRTWSNLQRRTVNGTRPEWSSVVMVRDYLSKGIELRMNRDEFAKWCNVNKEVILNLLNDGEVPSIDRLNSSGHYEHNNIRIISWDLNRNLPAQARRKAVDEYISNLPPKFCRACGKRLVRNSYSNGWREAASRFKLRVSCNNKCKYINRR